MRIDEPSWFRNAYRRLVVADMSLQLPGKGRGDPVAITTEDCRQLLGFASALALSDDPQQLKKAYEVVSRLIEAVGRSNQAALSSADFILSRLGNFPGRTLLRERYVSQQSATLSSTLHFERAAREVENTVTDIGGSDSILTDFQHKLLSSLERFPSVSVSAPTSAGKSFVMGLDLVRRLSRETPECVVYLVPTRALIREVSHHVRHSLRKAGLEQTPVRTVPFPLTRTQAPSGAVFVLTQERLMSLLHSRDGEAWITTLIVDEAQGVRDEARGVILQTAIEGVLIKFPKADVHFASPLTRNPDYLLRMAGREQSGSAYVEEVPPVSQNLIVANPVFRKPKEMAFEVLVDDEAIPLGTRDVPQKFNRGVYRDRAALARLVTADGESTIIYANDAEDAEELANALMEELPALDDIPVEITELIEFIRSEVSVSYQLAKCLAHGVAYHYGPMPAIVRTRIEDLCKARLIKVVCCTSTLLQGVNLPARHIILENPKRGRGRAMQRRDFLNLAGRAGRLLQEFHGNVWCLRTNTWEEPSYQGDRLQEIESAVDVAMVDGGLIVQRVLEGSTQTGELDYGEAVFGKLYADYVRGERSIAESSWRSAANSDALQETERLLKALPITLPTTVLNANRAVRPDRLQALYDFLQKVPDARQWMPLRPRQPNSNNRMGEIIELLLASLGGETNNRHTYLKQLAVKWIYNEPISKIISEHVNYPRPNQPRKSEAALIRNVLNDLDVDIRFRLVKYYCAFGSVLQLVLSEKGFKRESEEIEPFHVYLECGASDRVALSLISLGLSRSTAISLMKEMTIADDATPEDCLAELARLSVSSLPIPTLARREIAELLGVEYISG